MPILYLILPKDQTILNIRSFDNNLEIYTSSLASLCSSHAGLDTQSLQGCLLICNFRVNFVKSSAYSFLDQVVCLPSFTGPFQNQVNDSLWIIVLHHVVYHSAHLSILVTKSIRWSSQTSLSRELVRKSSSSSYAMLFHSSHSTWSRCFISLDNIFIFFLILSHHLVPFMHPWDEPIETLPASFSKACQPHPLQFQIQLIPKSWMKTSYSKEFGC